MTTPDQFVAKWKAADLKERAAAQSHFNDLCRLLDEPTPTDADPKGEWYCFERGATKTTGGEGWADVWKRGCFGWEYKSRGRSLDEAIDQLKRYALALENPPLLIACNLDRFRIVTNWTNAVSARHEFDLDGLREPENRERLKWAFAEPERLRPGLTRRHVTEIAAEKFAALARDLRAQGHDPQAVAHFVNRLVFCMFAEDIGLLPNTMFTRMLEEARRTPAEFEPLCRSLFGAMQSGGRLGFERVDWFNGGLFDDDSTLPLTRPHIEQALDAAAMDWSQIDPSVMGTLFERGLDPDKRSQLGAHYTDAEKIMKIIEPVIQRPLEAEWAEARAGIEAALAKAVEARSPAARTKARNDAEKFYKAFLDRLRGFRVLDPACGSGNFLYLALQTLKDLEHRAGIEAEALGLLREFPRVGPEQLLGIEINPYAAELARVSVWIGEIQWMQRNGFGIARNPILRPLETIKCRDALLNEDGTEVNWPNADVIIGNPPFLGGRKLKPELGEAYVTRLRRVFGTRLADGADLVCYWFDKANRQIMKEQTNRVGLVATNSISGGSNRDVLSSIHNANVIFNVWDDEPWTIDGAAVRVALVCFGRVDGEKARRSSPDADRLRGARLNGKDVDHIFPDLTARIGSVGLDFSRATALRENKGIAFQGVVPRGEVNRREKAERGLPDASFLMPAVTARRMLSLPSNPHGRPNSDVLRPYLIGDELTTRPLNRYIVDFAEMSEEEAALYEAAFEYLKPVRLHRAAMNQPEALKFWWRHWNTRPKMRKALSGLDRYIATPRVAKHRLFAWLPTSVLPDCQIVAIARADDVAFGVLHSRFHEMWTLRMCTYLGIGNDPRYTPSTTFETFPFPEGLTPNIPATEYAADTRAVAIAMAAKRLADLRNGWLNPPELVRKAPDDSGQLISIDEKAGTELKKRTLTKLYNLRPAWLAVAHKQLDAAVAQSYGWSAEISDEEAMQELLALNRKRAA